MEILSFIKSLSHLWKCDSAYLGRVNLDWHFLSTSECILLKIYILISDENLWILIFQSYIPFLYSYLIFLSYIPFLYSTDMNLYFLSTLYVFIYIPLIFWNSYILILLFPYIPFLIFWYSIFHILKKFHCVFSLLYRRAYKLVNRKLIIIGQ